MCSDPWMICPREWVDEQEYKDGQVIFWSQIVGHLGVKERGKIEKVDLTISTLGLFNLLESFGDD